MSARKLTLSVLLLLGATFLGGCAVQTADAEPLGTAESDLVDSPDPAEGYEDLDDGDESSDPEPDPWMPKVVVENPEPDPWAPTSADPEPDPWKRETTDAQPAAPAPSSNNNH